MGTDFNDLWRSFCEKNPKILTGDPVAIRPERLCAFGRMFYNRGLRQGRREGVRPPAGQGDTVDWLRGAMGMGGV